MKRGVGLALIGVGAFLLVLAPLLRWYAVPNLAKAPLVPGENTGGISTIVSQGTAATLFYPAKLAAGQDPIRHDVPLTNTRTTRGDVDESTSDEAKSKDLAIYDSIQTLVDDGGTLVNSEQIRVAFNRVSSELANCCGANVNGDQVVFEGINPVKFGFFLGKQTYPYFDTVLKKAVPIPFVSEETIQGLTVYKFEQTIEPTQIGEQEVPGSLVGVDAASYKAPRFYADVRTVWVEPTIGSIIKGQEVQKQTLRGPDGTDKTTLIDATIAFNDATVTSNVKDAKEAVGKLNLLKTTIPIVAVILGVFALVGGILLVRRRASDTSTVNLSKSGLS